MQTENEKNNMSAEATGGIAVLKWALNCLFLPFFWWLLRRTDKLEEKSYSKEETNNQIKLHTDPMRKELDKLSTSINVLSSVLTEFRVEVAKMSSKGDKE